MKTEKSGVYAWLDKATEPIKFGPDRRAARKELLDHIVDRAEDYQQMFPELTAGEAERKAVLDMGDPEPVGRELAAIHKPWLGWLWLVCRRSLCVLVIAAFLCGAISQMWGELFPKKDMRERQWEKAGRLVSCTDEQSRTEAGGYTLEITRVRREDYSFKRDDTEEELEGHRVYLTLRMTAKRPWDRPDEWNEGIFQNLWAVDSTGREAGFRYDREVMEDWFNMGGELPLKAGRAGLRWREFELVAYNMDPEAQWVELRHDFGGQTFTLRVALPDEVDMRSHHDFGPGTVENEEWEALKAVTEGRGEP